MKKIRMVCLAMALAFQILATSCTPKLSDHHGKLAMELFTGDSTNQPLIVGFGGSEGGNAWASSRWASTRQLFLDNGYAFLAIGYFGAPGTPDKLDRISLNAIHDSIQAIAKRHPHIDANRIVLIGGSKGGELVLNLASRFEGYSGVIALVAGHASFPAHTIAGNTSSWMVNDEEVAFVPSTLSSVPELVKGDLHAAFTDMMKDEQAVARARIPVEQMNCPLLLLSATKDEMWPSTYMSELVIEQLTAGNYAYPFEHIAITGNHAEPLNHFDKVIEFLKVHFPAVVVENISS